MNIFNYQNQFKKFQFSSLDKNSVQTICLVETIFDDENANKIIKTFAPAITEYICSNYSQLYLLDSNGFIVEIINSFSKMVAKEAIELKVAIDKIGISFSFVAMKRDTYLTCHLGDGNIISYDNGGLSVIFDSNDFALDVSCLFPMKQSVNFVSYKKGLMDGVLGFALLSKASFDSLYYNGSLFSEPIIELIENVGRSQNDEKLNKLISNYIGDRTNKDFGVCFLSKKNTTKKYNDLSNNEKVIFYKLPIDDNISFEKVRMFDSILYVLNQPKKLSELTNLFNLKDDNLKKILDTLERANLIQLFKGNYVRIL